MADSQDAGNGAPAEGPDAVDVPAARRQLALDGLGIVVGALGFGFVYGLAARDAGFSPVEVIAMSTLAFAGAAQFAAVGYVAGGLPWPGVVLLTALLNARHLLYSAALAPWLKDRPFVKRAVAAHLLTDEAFALSMSYFRRIGRGDMWGYWFAGVVVTFIPWNISSLAGVLVGGSIPEPEQLGIDVIFPAAMIGLAVGLITGRREIVAAVSGAAVGVVVALIAGTSVGIIAGGVIGPVIGLLVPATAAAETAPLGTTPSAERYSMPGTRVHADEPEAKEPRPPGAER